MTDTIKIQFLHNSAIDIVRWDQLIHSAPNSREYAMSWYLDILNPDWSALIMGDYEYVMPVVHQKKMGIAYAYQPVYAQQHGIFPPPSVEVSGHFFNELVQHFKYFEVALNHNNPVPHGNFQILMRNNFVLSLYDQYQAIFDGYSAHHQRYVRKAKAKLTIIPQMQLNDFLQLKKAWSGKSVSKWFNSLKQVVAHALARKQCLIYGAYSPNNQLCAAAVFLRERGRYTYLNSVSTDEGKTFRAMYAIIDQFIIDHAGKPLLLDFEGSDNEGIARFFQGFGAQLQAYHFVRYNGLPKFLRWLKK